MTRLEVTARSDDGMLARNHQADTAADARKIAISRAAKARAHRNREERGAAGASPWISGVLTKVSVKAMATALVARTTSLSSPLRASLGDEGLAIPLQGSCPEAAGLRH